MLPKNSRLPHYVLVSLLYGQLTCIRRTPQGGITLNLLDFAAVLGIRPTALRRALNKLQSMGLIRSLNLGADTCSLRLVLPTGGAWAVGLPVLDAETSV